MRYVPVSKLKPGPIHHKNLPHEILIRAKMICKILGDVIGLSLSEFIQNLQRDLHPHEEVQVWERIATTYLDITSGRDISWEDRRWIFSNLLSISMQSEEILQNMLESDDAFKKHLIHSYAGVVPPIPPNENEKTFSSRI